MVEEYEEIADPSERPDDQDDDVGKKWKHHIDDTIRKMHYNMQDTLYLAQLDYWYIYASFFMFCLWK